MKLWVSALRTCIDLDRQNFVLGRFLTQVNSGNIHDDGACGSQERLRCSMITIIKVDLDAAVESCIMARSSALPMATCLRPAPDSMGRPQRFSMDLRGLGPFIKLTDSSRSCLNLTALHVSHGGPPRIAKTTPSNVRSVHRPNDLRFVKSPSA